MYRLISFFILGCFGFIPQPFEEKEYQIEFTTPKELNIIKFEIDRYVEDRRVIDTGTSKNGKVIFRMKIKQPFKSRIALWLAPNEDKRSEVKFIDLIAEPLNLKIDASRGLEQVVYSGSRAQKEFTIYKASVVPLLKNINEKWASIYKAGKEGDKAQERKLKEEAEWLGKQLQQTKEAFIEKNSQSLVTALMLKDYVGPVWENLEKAEQYYKRLSPQLKALPDLVSFAKGLAIASTMMAGRQYPDFSLPDSTGKIISVSSLRGKYIFVDFWASWCSPCRQESPTLVAAYNKYNNKGFEILSVSFDEKKNAWLKAIAKDGYRWTNVIDTTGMGQKGALSSKLEIKAIPRNFLLDKEGKVIATNLRGEALEKKLKEVFGG